jgi:hypothetical protein
VYSQIAVHVYGNEVGNYHENHVGVTHASAPRPGRESTVSNRVLCIAKQPIGHTTGKTVNNSTGLITNGPTTNIVYDGSNMVEDKGWLHQEAESSQVIRFGMATMDMRSRYRSRNEELVNERGKQQ